MSAIYLNIRKIIINNIVYSYIIYTHISVKGSDFLWPSELVALANSPRNSGFHPHGQHEVLHIDQNSDESPQKLVDFPSTLTPPPAPKTKTSKAKMLLMVQIKKNKNDSEVSVFRCFFWSDVNSCWSNLQCSVPGGLLRPSLHVLHPRSKYRHSPPT